MPKEQKGSRFGDLVDFVSSPIKERARFNEAKKELLARADFQDLIDRVNKESDILEVYRILGEFWHQHKAVYSGPGDMGSIHCSARFVLRVLLSENSQSRYSNMMLICDPRLGTYRGDDDQWTIDFFETLEQIYLITLDNQQEWPIEFKAGVLGRLATLGVKAWMNTDLYDDLYQNAPDRLQPLVYRWMRHITNNPSLVISQQITRSELARWATNVAPDGGVLTFAVIHQLTEGAIQEVN